MSAVMCWARQTLAASVCTFAVLGCGPTAAPATVEPGAAETSGGDVDADATAESAGLPETFNPGHGETAFGVYLATTADGDTTTGPRLLRQLEERGVTGGGSGQLSCDQGAATTLNVDEDTVAISVSFRTRAEAELFVAAWGEPVVGIAEFVAYCRD